MESATTIKLTANFGGHRIVGRSKAVANKKLSIMGVSCFIDIFMQSESSVLQIKFSANKPDYRTSKKHYL